jgi:prepilin-type N-terminal cleavage/methylation domain-containing protein
MFKAFKKFRYQKSGMTLIELVIASTILLIVLTVVISTFANFSSSKRKILLTNELHNQTRFLLERIVREVNNGTIDYQGYWRENVLNKTADNWIQAGNAEGVNPSGGDIGSIGDDDFNGLLPNGINTYMNCNGNKTINHATDPPEDTDTIEKRFNIIFNYRYQFIFPGEESDVDVVSGNQNHLNCLSDNVNEGEDEDLNGNVLEEEYNIYDDEPAYGNGPRALDQGVLPYVYDSDINHVKSSEMQWSWDLAETSIVNNNPPLLLLKTNATEELFTRTNLRYKDNKIELIRFQSGEGSIGTTYDNDNPPDGIFDKWYCSKDFECGPSGNTNFTGTYIWSQKEVKKLSSPSQEDINLGKDNGIGTITDTDLHWSNITPEKIEVTSFEFIISPLKDPHKAFFEKEKIQKPQVTIIIETQVRKSAMKGIRGSVPTLRLQTTATPRIFKLIEVDN